MVGTIVFTDVTTAENLETEPLDKKKEMLKAMDVYSLGISFYEIIFGSNPFEGSNFGATIRRHYTGITESFKKSTGSPTIDKILYRMMDKDWEKRPDLQEVVEAFSLPEWVSQGNLNIKPECEKLVTGRWIEKILEELGKDQYITVNNMVFWKRKKLIRCYTLEKWKKMY